MRHSDQIQDLSKALTAAQGSMGPAIKQAKNSHFKNSYATLADIWNAIREPLSKNGLCVLQDVTTGDGTCSVTTRLMHVSGQWIEFGPLTIPLGKKDAQGVGAATTYAKRYSLAAAVGVIDDEDDDGNSIAEPPKNGPMRINESQMIAMNDLLMKSSNGQKHLAYLLKAGACANLSHFPAEKYEAAFNWLDAAVKKEAGSA